MASKEKKQNNFLAKKIVIGGTGLTQISIFAKHLSVMLKSGLTISEALMIVYESSQGKFRRIVRGVLHSVQSGNSLADSLKQYPRVFSSYISSTINAGEAAGTLDDDLENIALQLKKERELIAKIKGAMIYPTVILVAAFCLGLAITFLVLPKITPLFEGLKMELPLTTRGLIWFSHFVQESGLYLVIFVCFFIFIFIWFIKQNFAKPLTHFILLNTPLLSRIIKNANLSRIFRTLGSLLKSGLNIDEAFKITYESVDNIYFRRALQYSHQRIKKGSKLSNSLSHFKQLFPLMSIKMFNVGEKSGKLEETLFYLADFYEEEVDNSTKALSTAVEPLLLIFIGLVVGFLALSIITPIYNITGGVR